MNREPRVAAIVLAGGTIRDPRFRAAVGTEAKAFIDLLGKPMVQWTAEALKSASRIGSVAIVGSPKLEATALPRVVDHLVWEGTDEVDNLFRALELLPSATRVLMVSGDLPLLTPQAVNDLVDHAPSGADVIFPVCARPRIEREFPDRKWVFVKLADGAFTGSAGFLFRPEAVRAQRKWVQKVFDARRSVPRLAAMWGWWFLLRVLLRQATLAEVETRVSEVLALRGRAYLTPYPDLCMDVDKPSDVEIARARLASRNRSGRRLRRLTE